MTSIDGKAKWINDDCEKRFVFPLDRERAEGIMKIHATCEPSCPRKQTAADYLTSLRWNQGA